MGNALSKAWPFGNAFPIEEVHTKEIQSDINAVLTDQERASIILHPQGLIEEPVEQGADPVLDSVHLVQQGRSIIDKHSEVIETTPDETLADSDLYKLALIVDLLVKRNNIFGVLDWVITRTQKSYPTAEDLAADPQSKQDDADVDHAAIIDEISHKWEAYITRETAISSRLSRGGNKRLHFWDLVEYQSDDPETLHGPLGYRLETASPIGLNLVNFETANVTSTECVVGTLTPTARTLVQYKFMLRQTACLVEATIEIFRSRMTTPDARAQLEEGYADYKADYIRRNNITGPFESIFLFDQLEADSKKEGSKSE